MQEDVLSEHLLDEYDDIGFREKGSMVVGICAVELLLHNSLSLKAKRQVIKSILGRVRSKFDLSIAEVAHQDKWQKSRLGFAVVTNEGGRAHKMLENVIRHVERLQMAEIIDSRIEILHY